jgi:hypothetical protein
MLLRELTRLIDRYVVWWTGVQPTLCDTTAKDGPPGTWLLLHGLPEAEVGAGGVGDDAEPAHLRDFGFVSHDFCAEALSFCGGGGDVVDEDIGEPCGGRSGDRVLHHAAAGAAFGFESGVDHAATHVGVGELPVEERGVKGLCFGYVGGGEFDVTEGIIHGGSFMNEVGLSRPECTNENFI